MRYLHLFTRFGFASPWGRFDSLKSVWFWFPRVIPVRLLYYVQRFVVVVDSDFDDCGLNISGFVCGWMLLFYKSKREWRCCRFDFNSDLWQCDIAIIYYVKEFRFWKKKSVKDYEEQKWMFIMFFIFLWFLLIWFENWMRERVLGVCMIGD